MGKALSKSKLKLGRYESSPNTGNRHHHHNASSPPGPDSRGLSAHGLVQQFTPGHTEAVMCVAPVSPGVSLSGSKDQVLVLYDFKNGSKQQSWQGHEKEITKVAYGERIQSYFSASRDKMINMWQRGSPNPVLGFKGHDLVVTGLAINSENSQLCSGSRDNSLRLWCVETGQCLLQNSITRNLITHVCWANNSNLIAQTGEDKEVRIWDSRTLGVTISFPCKQHIQTWCDISEDGNYLVTSSNGFQGNGCEATLWDLRAEKIVHEFKGHVETTCCSMFVNSSITGGRNLVVTSSNDCSVRIWDRDTTACLSCLNIPASGPLTSIAVYPDKSMCVSSFNRGLHVLELVLTPDGEVQLTQRAQF